MTIFPESLRSSGLHIKRSPGEAFTPTPGMARGYKLKSFYREDFPGVAALVRATYQT